MNQSEDQVIKSGVSNENIEKTSLKASPLIQNSKQTQIKKKAPLIKSKNTRYYFDPFFDYPTKVRYFDFKTNEFFYSFAPNQGDNFYENDINPE